MTSPEVKALLMLAASDLNTSEIRALAQQVSKEGPTWLVRQVSALRDGQWQSAPQKSAASLRSSSDQERIDEFRLIINKVENLLLKEAGLSKTDASKILSNSIRSDPSMSEDYIPSGAKIAFDVWLGRLFDAVPPSLILHHASRIRNELVHGSESRSRWPLSRADD